MKPHLVTYLVIIVICIILSAYFSATETAFSTFNRIRIKNMAEKGNRRAAKALKLADNFDSLISTILIGNNIVNILSASLATLFFTGLISDNPDLAATVSTVVFLQISLLHNLCRSCSFHFYATCAEVIFQLLPNLGRS